jgi:hypothetical protein
MNVVRGPWVSETEATGGADLNEWKRRVEALPQ